MIILTMCLSGSRRSSLQEQCLLKVSEEIIRLSAFESECSRKDHEISVLQGKLTEVTNQLRLTNNDDIVKVQAELILRLGEEIQRLHRVEEEAQGKSQLIAELREEMQRMEQPSLQWERTVGVFTQQDRQSSHSEMELEAPQKMCPETELENRAQAEHTRERDECETMNKTLIKELEEIKHDYMISTVNPVSIQIWVINEMRLTWRES
ncbi:hypothetical protein AAFF_G00295260 [Aldrovandia affinis]|uniref:Uncharacterized protein n=1 Tax=Aldrovandia affinis TaxID=143900 RepID=A0AAD7W1B6_9TELE|nr:hypothetical protein AAFF_G00295260 [Aldrovandia affinis]